jgi:hypothetical protein
MPEPPIWLTLLGDIFWFKNELVVWDERTDTQLVRIFDNNAVMSIKRVGTTCNFITKSARAEVSLVTIKDIKKAEQISIRNLLEGRKNYNNYMRDLELEIT